MVKVVSEICCVHAQVGASAELMIGLRVAGITREDVRDALWRKRKLVKTVGLRGTLHLIPAEEVPVWMAANRLRFDAERKRYASLGLDVKNLDRLVDAIARAVGPEPVDRAELERRLASRVGELATTRNQAWSGNYPNWPLAMGFASALGHVCYGPGDGNRVTFVRLADWAGWRDEDPFESGLLVLRRFLHAYGPSTVAEFARWFSLDPAIARRLFAASTLVEVEVGGSRRWMLAEDESAAPTAHPAAVHLLPHFDVYVVGSHPRDQLIPADSPLAATRLGTAAPFAVLLAGGRVAGVWERRPKGKSLLQIRVGAHVPLSRSQRRSIEAQAERVAEILGLGCEVEFGDVSLKRHL